jgi:hypothetical protein
VRQRFGARGARNVSPHHSLIVLSLATSALSRGLSLRRVLTLRPGRFPAQSSLCIKARIVIDLLPQITSPIHYFNSQV